MSGSYQTTGSLNTEINTVFATGQAPGAITPSRVDQVELDIVATAIPTETQLTYTASLAWAIDTNPIAYVTLTGNVTITASAGQNGHSYRLAVIQDASGNRTVTLAGMTLLGAAVWQTAGNAVNILTVDVVNGTRYAGVM